MIQLIFFKNSSENVNLNWKLLSPLILIRCYCNFLFKLGPVVENSLPCCQGDLVVDNNPPAAKVTWWWRITTPGGGWRLLWLFQLIFLVGVTCRVSRAVQRLKCVNITFDLHSPTHLNNPHTQGGQSGDRQSYMVSQNGSLKTIHLSGFSQKNWGLFKLDIFKIR